jgi:hypothetical protein
LFVAGSPSFRAPPGNGTEIFLFLEKGQGASPQKVVYLRLSPGTFQGEEQMTHSELIVTGLIWILTAAGLFFGLRATLRRRRKR